ncbi:MAG: hypothetical protein FH748_16765 [Balneolaceae bacterium]|nr:hypothetical protein [Balneolaceae bacterium]
MKKIPSLHEQAFKFKNTKRLQHDGGRAWIKDSQLHEARKDANGRLLTMPEQTKTPAKDTHIVDGDLDKPTLDEPFKPTT